MPHSVGQYIKKDNRSHKVVYKWDSFLAAHILKSTKPNCHLAILEKKLLIFYCGLCINFIQ